MSVDQYSTRTCPHCGGVCLDCGAPIPPVGLSGCQHWCDDCLALRSAIRRQVVLDIAPRYCPECGREVVRECGRGRWPKTCSDRCARDRNERLSREARASRPAKVHHCRDCGAVVAKHRTYCEACAAQRNDASKARAAVRRKQRGVTCHVGTKKRELLDAFYSQGCRVCGVYAPFIMAAHHLDPDEKDYNIKAAPMALIEAELQKCVPLCFNHHQLIHGAMSNGGSGLSIDELVAYVKTNYPQTL